MSLILDHKNGIHTDWRLKNLQIVCPNCNATLDTHCRGIKPKRQRNKKTRDRGQRIDLRKVERPPLEQLIKEVNESNYVSVGKKYGVSDNAIRKWIKSYGSVPPKKKPRSEWKVKDKNR